MPIGPNKDLDLGMTATPARPDGAGAEAPSTFMDWLRQWIEKHPGDKPTSWQGFEAGYAAGAAAERARDGWFVYVDTDCIAAEHTTKRGLVAAGLTWEELGRKMVDAEQAWDEGMAARAALAGEAGA